MPDKINIYFEILACQTCLDWQMPKQVPRAWALFIMFYFLDVSNYRNPKNKLDAAVSSLFSQFHEVVVAAEDVDKIIVFLKERIDSFNLNFKRCTPVEYSFVDNRFSRLTTRYTCFYCSHYSISFRKVKELDLRINISKPTVAFHSHFQFLLF